MDKQRFRHLNITLNQNFGERHDIPQLHFTVGDLKWLMEQAEKVEDVKGFVIECDADDRAIQPHEILDRLNN